MNEVIQNPEIFDSNGDFNELDPDSVIEFTPENENTQLESEWNDQAMFCLLEEILKKKKEFHDPRRRSNKFYGQISELLIANSQLYFSPGNIERKFRALKRSFDLLCQHIRTEPERSINWPFFEKMMQIFAEELEIEDAPTMASLYPDLPLPRTAIPQKHENDLITESQSEQEHEKSTISKEKNTSKHKTAAFMSHKANIDFINECIREKKSLLDPYYPRKDVITLISQRMEEKGHFFPPETLDYKLKNLRRRYCQSVLKLRKKNPINMKNGYPWPYFNLMDSLYGSDEIKRKKKKPCRLRKKIKTTEIIKPVESECDFVDCDVEDKTNNLNFRKIQPKTEAFQQLDLPAPDLSPQETNFEISNEEFDYIDNENKFEADECLTEAATTADIPVMKVLEEVSSEETEEVKEADDSSSEEVCEFVRKMLEIEERRTRAVEGLLKELEESNRIRDKKLRFNQIKLSHLKARAKRKSKFNIL